MVVAVGHHLPFGLTHGEGEQKFGHIPNFEHLKPYLKMILRLRGAGLYIQAELGHTALTLRHHWPGLGWEEPWFLQGQSSKEGFSRERRGTDRKGNTNLLLGSHSSNLHLAAVPLLFDWTNRAMEKIC